MAASFQGVLTGGIKEKLGKGPSPPGAVEGIQPRVNSFFEGDRAMKGKTYVIPLTRPVGRCLAERKPNLPWLARLGSARVRVAAGFCGGHGFESLCLSRVSRIELTRVVWFFTWGLVVGLWQCLREVGVNVSPACFGVCVLQRGVYFFRETVGGNPTHDLGAATTNSQGP